MPNCKNCNQPFTITEQDRAFYRKIEVPEPTWCPACREMRRMAWCNEGVLYSGKCGLCRRNIISEFSPDNPRKVYCLNCWWGDKWDSMEYALELDLSGSFFNQLHELELRVPHACVSSDLISINSEYTHHAGQNKNCYLIYHATFNEDCYYSYGVKKDKDCIDVHNCFSSELCYECVDVHDCYGLAWSQDCVKCSSSYWLRDCVGCSDCFMCVGLRQKKHCFLNEQFTQKEYEKKLSAVNTGSFIKVDECQKQFLQLQAEHIYRFAQMNKTQNSSGNYLYHAFGSNFCFDCNEIEQSNYCSQMQLKTKDCYDMYQFGINLELSYEGAMIGVDIFNSHFCFCCIDKCSNLLYCIESYTSDNCFLCSSIQKKKYCILNKQYSEKEYFELRNKIIAKMTIDGEYGEYFPVRMSPFGYNETTAQLWFPLTKEAAVAKGWPWRDNLPGTFGRETLKNIPDDIKDVRDDITKEILACVGCKKNYKILVQELDFYRRNSYPIPRYCFECRRIARMKKRNQRYLYQRQCMCDRLGHQHSGRCAVEFETTYAPERPEKVYCEACYQKEIY
ncbi:zinc-ribbon domain containing protein [Candidatus Falkowbacteria bacterium]|nr:zinc-ribbon domain containing protein [Candidatus Falkowbacteria bacterium]